MREEYDIKNLNPRRNPYAESLKEDQQMVGHYHCHICGSSFPKKEAAEECFWGHGELAVLRWLAFEAFCTKRFAERYDEVPEDLPPYWFKIEKMNELYQFAEDDEKVIWNKVLPGQRI